MRTSFQAEQLIPLNKTGLKRLRNEGRVPAHIYGSQSNQIKIHILAKDFESWVRGGSPGNVEICLENNEIVPVLVGEVQRNPVTQQLLHVDFKRA
ncbi:50S ribosomal protein L25 [compost metagenome]